MPEGGRASSESRPAGRFPRLVIMGLTARLAGKWALLWGLVFGIVVFFSTYGYISAYPTLESRAFLAQALGANAGLQALLGESKHVDTVAGLVEWRALGVLTFLGAIWALLTGTSLLRGEEEAGRWEMLLSGHTTRRRATAGALAGLAISLVLLWVVIAIITVATGRYPGADFPVSNCLYFALALTGSAWVCMAIAALASQLAPTRRTAATWAAGFFGAMFLARAIGDSAPSLNWIRQLTPLGWIEQLHPLTGGDPFMLVPVVVFIAVLLGAAIYLAGSRDLGASALPDHDTAPTRTRLLNGPLGLIIRLMRGNLLAWIAAVGTISFMFGLITQTVADALNQSTFIQALFRNLGARSIAAENFLGMIFFLITALVSLYAASQTSATREEEAGGQLDNLFVRLVTRVRWMTERAFITLIGMVILGVAAGLIAWVGAYTQGSGIGLTKILAAGLNTVPPGILVLGFGIFIHGLLPRFVSIAVYGLVAWSFLVELVGSLVKANHYFLDLSIFHHMALAPAADIKWDTVGIFVAIGFGLTAAGILLFNRRDLAGA